MARASRQGVDYFPLNVYLDNKFKILEAKHGLSGFAVAIKLMQNVYAEGYWLEFGDDERFLFASDNRIDQVEFDSILETCLEKGIFNKEMFKKYNILTSRGIQKQYKEMTKRRKEVDVVEDYLLCADLMNAQCKQDVDTMHSNKHKMNANKSPQNSNSHHSDNKSTQTETETENETETETENETENELEKRKNIISNANDNDNDNEESYHESYHESSEKTAVVDAKKDLNYKSVYDHYIKLGLVKHRTFTDDMKKAISSAMKNNKYTIEYCMTLLDRHKQIVEITKGDGQYSVRPRSLEQFFGQKAFNAKHLICSEYDEGGDKYLKLQEMPKEKTDTHASILAKMMEEQELE